MHFIKFSALLLVCCAFIGCGKEDGLASKLGSVYGTVTDFATGDPISNANVRLNPRGETTLTGYDGTFQFNDIEDGSYSLSLSKNGYVDLDDDYVIEITNGNNVQRDVLLCSEYQSFKIVVNGIEADTLDFGIDPNLYRMYYSVVNDGTIDIRVVFGQSANWITREIGSASIASNNGITTYVTIDREDLNIGTNIGYIYVSSGTLSKTLVVKAVGVGLPIVSDPVLTSIQSASSIASSSVISNGGSQILEKGFQYYRATNSAPMGPYTISLGPGEGSFQTQIPLGSAGYTHHQVRSYASNGVHTVYSGWVNIN